jgi:hypothetical protein
MSAKEKDILEFVQTGKPKVESDNAIIRDVKILGHTSQNGHSYAPAAVSAAKNLYEGSSVFLDHPTKPDQERKIGEQVGWLESVRVEADGLYGNLHLLKSHPASASILEVAGRRPDKMGLSHNAVVSESVRPDGKIVFEQIHRVRSVDLVCRPATTRGIFESVQKEPRTMKKTVKEILEAIKEKIPAAGVLRKVLEEDGMAMVADAPVEVAPEASGDDQVSSAFKAMVVSVLDDTSLDLAGKKKKIGDILAAQEKLTAKAEETPSASETPATESVKAKSEEGKLDRALSVLEAAGISTPTAVQIKLVSALDGQPEHQKAVAESWKPTGNGTGVTKPKSTPKSAMESQQSQDAGKARDEFFADAYAKVR